MPSRRRTYSATRARRTSRQVNERTVGSHVARGAGRTTRRSSHDSAYALAVARKARFRRFVVGIIAVLVVVGLAVGAGLLAFRGTVGGELALRDSDATSALTSARSGEANYTLITAETGSVAAPLDNGGPDVILLARLDPERRKLALINVPSQLQITFDNKSDSASAVASTGDAALISAISTFAKVDISHFIKIEAGDIEGIVDTLGGVQVDVEQLIDDPHAGTSYIPRGTQTLDGSQALTFLRATNLKFAEEDQLKNQLKLASSLIEKIFSSEGSFSGRIESIDSYLQTNYSLADFEGIYSWLAGATGADIICATVPGYYTTVTNVSQASSSRYIGSSEDMATLIDDLDQGRDPSVGSIGGAAMTSPASFTIDIENGTTVEGAASATAALLKSQGFNIGDVGNAEEPVYEETLVIYKDSDEGLKRANTVIDALGVGRAIEKNYYYTFEHDILVVLGADNKPIS